MYEKLTFTPDTFTRETQDQAGPAISRHKDILTCIRPQISRYSLLALQDGEVFGRSHLADGDSSVSGAHFQYENSTITDLDSTNGTYVNGRRIITHTLTLYDKIQCGLCGLQYLGDCFLIDHDPAVKYISQAVPEIKKRPSSVIDPLEDPRKASFSLEAWSLREPAARPSLFLSCGSSLLMGASSLLSAALMQAADPEASVGTSLVMSLSMSAGFLLYGLLSRHISHKNELQACQAAMKQYDGYLDSLKQEVLTLQQIIARQHQKVLRKWETLDASLCQTNTPLCIGTRKTVVTSMTCAAFTWQHRMHPLYEKVQKVLDAASQPVRTLRYLDKTDKIIQADPGVILARVIWTQRPDAARIAYTLPVDVPHRYEGRTRIQNKPWDFKLKGQSVCIQGREASTPDWNKLKQLKFYADDKNDLPVFSSGPCLNVQLAPGVWLDLVNDGPHGLVAGTTGSGKSEVLSTLLVRLIQHNHPDHLRYILVDFKGGSFARPFQEMPHHAGTVTDLDSHELDRLVRTLRGELRMREQCIQTCLATRPSMTADLDSCQPYLQKPLCHLLVIVDEFAQLKQQYPAYMEFLQEIARTGRSLGIHLILSTQKPGGIVSQQILANTGFVIACKVRDPMESLELLGTREAAELGQPGQAILATDQGHILFQADYVRAPLRQPACLFEGNTLLETAGSSQSMLEHCLETAQTLYPSMPLIFEPTRPPETGVVRLFHDDVHTFEDLCFTPGQKIRVQCPGQLHQMLKVMKSHLADPYYVEDYPDGSRWFLYHMGKPCTLIFKDELPKEPLENALVIILETTPHLWEVPFDHTFVCGRKSDLVMFGSHEDMPFPAGCAMPGKEAICFAQPQSATSIHLVPDLDSPDHWNEIFQIPVLGKADNEPVFWTKPCLRILGEDARSMEKMLAAWGVTITEDPDCPDCLFTTGWQQLASQYGLPWLSASWVLKTEGSCIGLEPLASV